MMVFSSFFFSFSEKVILHYGVRLILIKMNETINIAQYEAKVKIRRNLILKHCRMIFKLLRALNRQSVIDERQLDLTTTHTKKTRRKLLTKIVRHLCVYHLLGFAFQRTGMYFTVACGFFGVRKWKQYLN